MNRCKSQRNCSRWPTADMRDRLNHEEGAAISPEGTGTLKGGCVRVMPVWIWKAGSKSPLPIFIGFATRPKKTNRRVSNDSLKTQLLPAGWGTIQSTPLACALGEDTGADLCGVRALMPGKEKGHRGMQGRKVGKEARSPRQIRQTYSLVPS